MPWYIVNMSPSVEIIAERVFDCSQSVSEFESGSRLRSLDFEAFVQKPKCLVISNENSIMIDDGVVVSLNPRGIVFVPKYLDFDSNVEVIYSHAFEFSEIAKTRYFFNAFWSSWLRSIRFDEGTYLEVLREYIFAFSDVGNIILTVDGKSDRCSTGKVKKFLNCFYISLLFT